MCENYNKPMTVVKAARANARLRRHGRKKTHRRGEKSKILMFKCDNRLNLHNSSKMLKLLTKFEQ